MKGTLRPQRNTYTAAAAAETREKETMENRKLHIVGCFQFSTILYIVDLLPCDTSFTCYNTCQQF